MEEKKIRCQFCGHKATLRNPVFKTRSSCICSECVEQMQDHLMEMKENNHSIYEIEPYSDEDKQTNEIPTPKEIVRMLDRKMVGQEQAKKTLAVAVYNHYKRINIGLGISIPKSNILMIGPTGCGKTFLLENIANIVGVPMVVVDSTTFSETGYAGYDVDFILQRLIDAAGGDISRAESGIIYIDEIDKISANKKNSGYAHDISREGVQRGLLKLLEGSRVSITVNAGRPAWGGAEQEKRVEIDTKNILFVCGGAFSGLENNIRERMGLGKIITTQPQKPTIASVQLQDLISYGIMPELLGRMQTITILDQLCPHDLEGILSKIDNSLTKQYQQLFDVDGVELRFDSDALSLIAQKAFDMGTGARGLVGICEQVLLNWMYETPGSGISYIRITKDSVLGTAKPIIRHTAKRSIRNFEKVRALG